HQPPLRGAVGIGRRAVPGPRHPSAYPFGYGHSEGKPSLIRLSIMVPAVLATAHRRPPDRGKIPGTSPFIIDLGRCVGDIRPPATNRPARKSKPAALSRCACLQRCRCGRRGLEKGTDAAVAARGSLLHCPPAP